MNTPNPSIPATPTSLEPFVSVIMPVRNEAAYIERSIGAVLAQDYPAECLEIIVVDGMSTDGTRARVGEFQTAHPNIRLVDNPKRVAPAAMNAGLQAARGEVIVRVDGHCEIAPDYLRRCIQHLKEDRVDCVGGPIETIGETGSARAIAVAMSSPFGVGNSAFRTVKDRSLLVDSVAFPAYTRQAVEKTGLYDEELVRNQDDEYNYRLRKLGGRILLSPDIRSRYYSRSSLRSLWKQYFQYGYWKVRVLQKHPGQMSLRQFIPPLFVLALGLSGILALLSFPGWLQFGWLALALVTCSYLLANWAATVIICRRSGWCGWLYFGSLSLAFAILHLSYGSGFLIGLVKFASRWKNRVAPLPVGEKSKGFASSLRR